MNSNETCRRQSLDLHVRNNIWSQLDLRWHPEPTDLRNHKMSLTQSNVPVVVVTETDPQLMYEDVTNCTRYLFKN